MINSYLYILSNQIYNNFIKFGFTTNPEQRFKNYVTYSPYPYKLERLWLIKDYENEYEIDKLLKNKINNINLGGGTEFYILEDYDIIVDIYKELGYELILTGFDKNKINFPLLYSYKQETINNYLLLRPHQKIAVDKIKELDNFCGLYQVCVGGGKTFTGINMHLALKNVNTLWICYRNNIIDSQKEDFKLIDKNNIMYCHHGQFNIDKAVKFLKSKGKILVVLHQSLHDIEKLTDYVDFVIIDEAHMHIGDNAIKVLNTLKNKSKYFLGMSATPYTDTNNKQISYLYNDNFLVEPYDMFQAYNDNYLVEPKIVIKFINNIDIINDTLKYAAPTYKQIFRCKDINKVEELYKKYKNLNNNEFKFYKTHSNMKTNESLLFEKDFYESIDKSIMFVCDKLETGYNDPPVSLVSLATGANDYPSHRIIQLWGRSLRKYDNKESGTIIIYFECSNIEDLLNYIVNKILQKINLITNNKNSQIKVNNNYEIKINNITIQVDIDKEYIFTCKELENKINEDIIKQEYEKDFNYNSAKKLIKLFNIKTINEYNNLCDKYDKLPRKPDEYYTKYWKSWADFFNYDLEKYYTFNDCLSKIKEIIEKKEYKWNKINNTEILLKLINLDNKFPPYEIIYYYYKEDSLLIYIENIIKKNYVR